MKTAWVISSLFFVMKNHDLTTTRDLLLARRGLVFLSSSGASLPDHQLRAIEIEFAGIGYVFSTALRMRLAGVATEELLEFRTWAHTVLLAQAGGNRRHEPLFRHFPDDVPDDTLDLWHKKVLSHFLQAKGQPCLFCRRNGTTHVLNPCQHVVCDQCFDGTNYSACPVCEHQVDRSSPFFQKAPEREPPSETVIFKLLDLGESITDEAQALFISLCERRQALAPADRDALVILLREYKACSLAWLPAVIPVRENIAIIFGTLLQACSPDEVLPHARRYLGTATDVLRFIAVLSGTDGSLMRETVFRPMELIERIEGRGGLARFLAKTLGIYPSGFSRRSVIIPRQICRFKMAPLSRPLRRMLLGLLENMNPERLCEDMLRHRSYWVWVGQFLHPHEYAAKFPNAAAAFLVVRGNGPDGSPAPVFRGWNSRFEQTLHRKDVAEMLAVLAERPGEFARRFDHVLRMVGNEPAAARQIMAMFVARMPSFATPVLLTLRSHLSHRFENAGIRIYWPKGRVARGVSSPDLRNPLPPAAIAQAVHAIEAELLRRFASKPAFAECLIDAALHTVMVPFNERTASVSAVSLPRGSRIPVPAGKQIRLFLHWCQPEKSDCSADLDLSVAFYSQEWQYLGVCSYYQLKCLGRDGSVIATSSGDRQNAPWPDGATEFIDVQRDLALAAGVRYAIMVVNNYAGMPFSLLDRGFAGLMLRDDLSGWHFDPRTVELKFALDGENGVFLPLVLDIREEVLHWLDVHAKGKIEMNNVETSKSAIAKICPEQMAYFASGVRPSMFDLALLHAASRCKRVFIRGQTTRCFERQPGESLEAFHARLVRGEPDEPGTQPPGQAGPLMAILYRGDSELPKGSVAYALFRQQMVTTLAASDLLS